MADQWFYRMFGEEFGPMPLKKLKELADAGTVQALDYVRCGSSQEWVAAATIDELRLSASERRTVPAMATTSAIERGISASAVNDDWFCQFGGQELGPLSFDELLEYVENEQLGAEDQVKLGVRGKWRRVGSIGRLMAALPYQAVEKTIVPSVLKPAVSLRPAMDAVTAAPRAPIANPPIVNPIVAIPQPPTGSDPQVAATVRGVVDRVRTMPPESFAEPEAGATRSPQMTSVSGGFEASSSRTVSPYGTKPVTAPYKPHSKKRATSDNTWLSDMVEKLKEPKALSFAGAIALAMLIFGWGFLPKSRAADIKRYQTLKGLVDEIRSKRTSSPTDLPPLQQKLEKTAKEIVSEVKDKAGREEPAKQCLLWATRDEVPRVLRAGLTTESNAEKVLLSRLLDAAYELGLEQRPAVALTPVTAASDD